MSTSYESPSPFVFEDLPILCVYKIAKILSEDPINVVSQTAANLTQIGYEGFSIMLPELWNAVDPGCIEDLKTDGETLKLIETLHLSHQDTSKSLKEVAKTIKVNVSGTKDTLIANIKCAKDEITSYPASTNSPVRKMVRELVQALNNPAQKINQAEAKTRYRLSYLDIFEVFKGLREQRLSDVIKYSMNKYGCKHGPMTPRYLNQHKRLLEQRKAIYDLAKDHFAPLVTKEELCVFSNYANRKIVGFLNGSRVSYREFEFVMNRIGLLALRKKMITNALEREEYFDVPSTLYRAPCHNYIFHDVDEVYYANKNTTSIKDTIYQLYTDDFYLKYTEFPLIVRKRADEAFEAQKANANATPLFHCHIKHAAQNEALTRWLETHSTFLDDDSLSTSFKHVIAQLVVKQIVRPNGDLEVDFETFEYECIDDLVDMYINREINKDEILTRYDAILKS